MHAVFDDVRQERELLGTLVNRARELGVAMHERVHRQIATVRESLATSVALEQFVFLVHEGVVRQEARMREPAATHGARV